MNKRGRKIYFFLKRLFDYLFCAIGLPFFVIIFLFVSIAIKIEDGGPVFYRAKRIGKNSVIFDMYKFRSMKVNAPNIVNEDGSTYNSKDDCRVTKVGRFIRMTSLDETAQIINVLKGNMTAIGPRASGEGALGTFKCDELHKMNVRPGITGYTQAYFRNGLSVREKRLYDAWYADNASFWLDTKIFVKTIVSIITRKNLYTN